MKAEKYQAIVMGSANLEINIKDSKLAERLLKEFPGGNRKLYPNKITKKEKGYLIEPSGTFPLELWIPENKVIRIATAGGGANASKILAHLGVKLLFLTSLGSKGDENYETMVNSLKENPEVNFFDVPGRIVIGITLNIIAKGIPSTLLIYTGGEQWQKEKFEEKAERIIKNLDLEIPILAIANSPPYLPLLEKILNKKGRIDYFCPGRTHINILEKNDLKYFEKATFIQDNIDNIADALQALSFKKGNWTNKTRGVLEITKKFLNSNNNMIITKSEEGGFFIKGKDKKVRSYKSYPLPYDFVDDTGAGDTFAAAFFYYYFLKKKMGEESIRFAAATATFPIGAHGATSLLPEEIMAEKWMRKYWSNLDIIE